MSHQATKWALRQRGLKPAAKIVLFYLCDHHNDDLGCFPSQETLAAECEMSRSTLNLQLTKLEELGLIRRHAGVDDRTKRQRPTRYILGFEGDFRVRKSDESRVLKSDNAVSENETRAVSEKQGEPCPKNDESRVLKSDTNPVREPLREPTTAREAQSVVVDAALSRREQVLILMGCSTAGVTPAGRFTGGTGDMAEPPKWDALGLTTAEQDAKITEMLDRKRRSVPGFVPNTWGWFTAGMSELAEAKKARTANGAVAGQTETPEQRRARRRRMIGN